MTDDLDRIMAVMNAAFDPVFGEAWTRRQVEDALAFPGTHYVLIGPDGEALREQDEAAGFALSRGATDEEELLLIAVSPAYQRRGIGDSLLGLFIQKARARGATRLFLEMRDGNPAEALYRKHGFTTVGRRRDYYRRGSGSSLDALTMALQIEG